MLESSKDRCHVHMYTETGGHTHLHFWCEYYRPYRVYYPRAKYIKGEEICLECCVPWNGVMYRASFQCARERTPAITKQQIIDLFRWLYGIETKRNAQKKTTKKSKERDDIHRTDIWTSSGLLQDNTKREEVNIIAEEVGKECTGIIPTIDDYGGRRLPGLPEASVQNYPIIMSGEITCSTMSPVRSESEIPGDQRPEVGIVPSLQEQDMREVHDDSFYATTVHSCITCKCGTKVWYGCGVKQLTRPKYCPKCEKIETIKIAERYQGSVDAYELQRIIDWELRRSLNR